MLPERPARHFGFGGLGVLDIIMIPANAAFNIEHERSGSDEELEFQLLWTRQ